MEKRRKKVDTLVFVTMWTRALSLEQFMTNTGMNIHAAVNRAKLLRKQGVNLKFLKGESTRGIPASDLNDIIRQEELKAKNENA